MERLIFHIDVNSAFLSWEAAYRIHHLGGTLDLRTIPSVIGGSVESRHGIILAKSIPAKKYNIQTGEPVVDAKRKCPNLYIAPPNYNLYQRCSKALMNLLAEYSPSIEQYSVDEAFMDLTDVRALLPSSPIEFANTLRMRIESELGFTVNIGISSNKVLAKMASDFQKPNMTHTLFPDEIQSKMWILPVNDLFFVGRASFKKLKLLGIYTIGDLATSNLDLLKRHLKKHGETIWNFANGIDFSPVVDNPLPNKGYGNSTTIAFDVTDSTTAKHVLLSLCETVATRLRKNQVKAEVLSIQIKTFELQTFSHQKVLPTGTNITKELYCHSCLLFDELWSGVPIRHLGVHTSRVKEKDFSRQLHLFDHFSLSDTQSSSLHFDYQKYEVLDKTIDDIRTRHGIDALKRAAFINSSIDHLNGGISREKRTVDYNQIEIF